MGLYEQFVDGTHRIPKAWRKQILLARIKEEISHLVAVGAGYGRGGVAPEEPASPLLLRLIRWSSPSLRCKNGTPCWPGVVAAWFLIPASEGDATW